METMQNMESVLGMPLGEKRAYTKQALSGATLALYKGVIEEGKRLSVNEWKKVLGYKYNSAVYGAMRTIASHGFHLVTMKPDPMSKDPVVVVPLTESREICRVVNTSGATEIHRRLGRYTKRAVAELEVYPDLAPELAAHLDTAMASITSSHKMILDTGRPTYVPKLSSGHGATKQN